MSKSAVDNINDTHPYIKLSIELQDFVKPLALLNVTHFSYIKNHQNGEQIYLSSDPQWVKDYYEHQLYLSSAFEANPKHYKQPYALWSTHMCQAKVMVHGLENFKTDNGITVIKPITEGCEFYFFSGSTDHIISSHNKFINNLHALHHFIFFFNEHFGKTIKKLSGHQLAIRKAYLSPSQLSPGIIQTNENDLSNEFFKQTKIRRLYLQRAQFDSLSFSPQQTNCIRSILQFKTASEAAQDLGVTQRTVESYFEQLKNKLNCQTKVELYDLLIDLKNIL